MDMLGEMIKDPEIVQRKKDFMASMARWRKIFWATVLLVVITITALIAFNLLDTYLADQQAQQKYNRATDL